MAKNDGVIEEDESTAKIPQRPGTAAIENQYVGDMAGGPLAPFFTQVELTADQVKQLYDLGRKALAL